MKIIFIGDIVGRPGREAVATLLPQLKKKFKPDFVIANGENLASGKGITPKIYQEMIDDEVDLLTSGNHILKREDIIPVLDDPDIKIIRPANWEESQPGHGIITLHKAKQELVVINLQGQAFIDFPADSPFECLDKLLEDIKSKHILVDMHAETTAEKRALAEYAGKRISAMVGTHTHVQTADEQILSGHTGFITDAGMTGPADSVLGIEKKLVLERFLTGEKTIFKVADGPVVLGAVFIELDRDGKTTKIERINKKIKTP